MSNASRFRRSLLSAAANATYRSGLLRGLSLVANRWKLTRSRNGTGGFPYLRRRKGRNVQILVYHRVAPEPDEFLPSLSVESFTRQMDHVARHCRVLSLVEAVAAIESNSAI